MGAIEDIKQNIQHDKSVIDGKRQEVEKLNHDLRYYEGHLDGMNTALNIINNTEGTK